MAEDPTDNGGRVTTRRFYDALLDQNDRMDDMERRILARCDGLATEKDIEKIDKRLTYQERKSNVQDVIVSFFGVFAGGLSAWLFGKQ